MSDGRLVSEREQGPGAQTQEIQDPFSKLSVAGIGFIEPPFNLNKLATLLERNTPHYRAVKAKASDSVERGWSIVADAEKPSEADKKIIEAFFRNPNPRQTLASILSNAIVDYEGLGNGYVEVARSEAGKVGLLNHIPAKTVRIGKDFNIYAHIRGNLKTFFKPFGDKRIIQAKTGEEKAEGLPHAARANELIHFLKYHPKSDYYGIPDIIPAMGALLGDIEARDFNLDFFENGAIPAYAVVIEGADVTPEVQKSIEDFFKNDLKGTGNQHRSIILAIPFENVKVRFEKLSVDPKDASFKLYRQDNRDEILSANGVPPLRAFYFQAGALGRDVSREQNTIYQESTVKPIREMVEQAMSRLIREGLMIQGFSFDLNDIEFDDRELLSKITETLARTRATTINEMRRFASPLFEGGLKPVDGGDEIFIDAGGFPTAVSGIFKQAGKSTKAFQDRELTPQEFAEYDGAKRDEVLDVLRSRASAVGSLTDSLILVFNETLKKVYKNFAPFVKRGLMEKVFSKQKPVSVNVVLDGVDDFSQSVKKSLAEAYGQSLEAGVRFAARKLGANLNVEGKAVVGIPNVAITVSFALQNPAVQRFIESQTGPISDNIVKTLSNRIRHQIELGIEKGETNEQIAERLQKHIGIPDLRDSEGRLITSEVRAQMIARTEVARAYNEGTIIGYKSSDVVDAVDVIDGEDFDEPCQTANGQRWTFDQASANPIQHPNCFIDPQIPVYTSKGWKPIGKVKIGDLALTHRGRFRRVKEVIRTQKQKPDVATVCFGGRTWQKSALTATSGHPIFTDKGWIPIEQLKPGHSAMVMAKPCPGCGCDVALWLRRCVKCKSEIGRKTFERFYAENPEARSSQTKARYKIDPTLGARLTQRAHDAVRGILRSENDLMRRAQSKAGRYFSPYEDFIGTSLSNAGFDVSPNHAVGKFNVDLAMPSQRIAFEIDGGNWHNSPRKRAQDVKKEAFLRREGWDVVRLHVPTSKNLPEVVEEAKRIAANHSGKYHFVSVVVRSVKHWKVAKSRTLYNLSVADDESYLAKGIAVHNCTRVFVPVVS